MMASLPKICAVALVLAAGSSDGRIPPLQSGHGQNYQVTTTRPAYGIHAPSTSSQLNCLVRDPWFHHYDLWHDPFSWGHHGHHPWTFSHQPWGAGLSYFGPSLSAKRNEHFSPASRLGCHKCQDNAAGTNERSRGETELPQQRGNHECQRQRQEADNQRNAQLRRDLAYREREQHQRETERQMEEQRLQQEKQRWLKEEAELKRHEEERRLQEERRMQQRRQEEETERSIRSKEEQRLKERLLRQRQEEEAEAIRIQRERERQRMQEEEATYERQQWEMGRGHPHQGMRTNTRYSHNSKNQREQFKKTQVASLTVSGYTPDDITVRTSGNRLMVHGKHVCDCHEKCTEREFQRSFAIPRNIDPASLGAKLTKDGQLTVNGNQYNTRVQSTNDLLVAVEGDGSFTSRPRNVDSTCGGRRKGFMLKKMNKRTGQIVEDYEDLVKEMDDRTFEDEVDEDGVTMEVVD